MFSRKGLEIYAKFVSLLFYPSFLQTLMASWFVVQLKNILTIWLCFLVIPIIFSLVYLYLVKMPNNHKWVVPKEFRLFPLFFAFLGNLLFYLIFIENESFYVKVITLSSIFLTSLSILITYFWKISLHMIGMGAFTAFFLIFFPSNILFFLVVLLFSQQVAWARMFLKSHDIWQILAGYLLGITCFTGAYFGFNI